MIWVLLEIFVDWKVLINECNGIIYPQNVFKYQMRRHISDSFLIDLLLLLYSTPLLLLSGDVSIAAKPHIHLPNCVSMHLTKGTTYIGLNYKSRTFSGVGISGQMKRCVVSCTSVLQRWQSVNGLHHNWCNRVKWLILKLILKLIFYLFPGAQVCIVDCGTVYPFYVLFDVCNCYGFMCIDVCDVCVVEWGLFPFVWVLYDL